MKLLLFGDEIEECLLFIRQDEAALLRCFDKILKPFEFQLCFRRIDKDVLQLLIKLQCGGGERNIVCFAFDGVFDFGDLLFRLRDETADGGMDDD